MSKDDTVFLKHERFWRWRKRDDLDLQPCLGKNEQS